MYRTRETVCVRREGRNGPIQLSRKSRVKRLLTGLVSRRYVVSWNTKRVVSRTELLINN